MLCIDEVLQVKPTVSFLSKNNGNIYVTQGKRTKFHRGWNVTTVFNPGGGANCVRSETPLAECGNFDISPAILKNGDDITN